mgnify:CR=1 FL=1
MLGPNEFTPEEAFARVCDVIDTGGDAAIAKFLEKEPAMYLSAGEYAYRVLGDDEGLEALVHGLTRLYQDALNNSIEQHGLAHWYEVARKIREKGEHETADKIERHLKCLQN